MLLQKYRPKSLDGIIGNRLAAHQLRRHILAGDKAVLTGPPGCGKSLALQLIAKELRYELLDESPEDLLKASGQRSLWYNGKILVADVDIFEPQEALGLLKAPWPVVFVTGDIYERRLLPLRKAVANIVKFRKVGWADTLNFLERVCRQEGIAYDRASLGEAARLADGDLRWCLLMLEGAGRVDAEFVARIGKEKVTGIFDVLDTLFSKSGVLAGAEDLPWIVENLPECYSGGSLAFAYRCIAAADAFKRRSDDYFVSFLSLLPRSPVRPQYKVPSWAGNGFAGMKEIAARAHCSVNKARSYAILLPRS